MIIMGIDLSSIGIEKGRQYETIITTKNSDGTYNAAPIGVLCSGPDKIVNRIFKTSHTLDNILKTKEFTVNITHDSELFTISTLGNLSQDSFRSDGSIKNVNVYFKCRALFFKEAIKQSDPIKKKDEAIVFKSEVYEIIKNDNTQAFNRGFSYVVESLANLTRFDMVDLAKKEEYIKQFREAYRVVRKVGRTSDIEAMKEIKKELVKKGFNL